MADSMHAASIDEPDLKMYRLNHSRREGALSVVELYYVVGTPEGVSTFREEHVMGLFSREQHEKAMRAAGLEPSFDPEGPSGRGLHIGRMPRHSPQNGSARISARGRVAEAGRRSRTPS